MSNPDTFIISDTSPATAVTAIGDVIPGLDRYERFLISADLVGAVGGTLDVYLQRQVAPNVWRDWIHFPQLGAGAAAVKYAVAPADSNTIVVVGSGDDSTAAPALAANTCVGGHPGSKVRAVYVGGASTSAGAAVTIRIQAWRKATS